MGTTTDFQDCNVDACRYPKEEMAWGIVVGDIKNWAMDKMSKCCCDNATLFDVSYKIVS